MESTPVRLISLTVTANRVNRSRWWVTDEVRAGRFPRPIRDGNRTDFVESEIDAWIRERAARRDAAA